jgi:broad specificity phosphatase PhoE
VVLVRHAEAGDSNAGDPDLSAAGEARAAKLGTLLTDVLGDRNVDYLYAADTRRAQQTAAPVANEFKLPINVLSSSDWAGSRLAHQAGPSRQDGHGRWLCQHAAERARPIERRQRCHARRRVRLDLFRRDAQPGRDPRPARAIRLSATGKTGKESTLK